jgi:DNA-binding NarL/FixJ family response regulator
MRKIRVLLVDDHAIVRQGLRVLLEKEPDLAIVGEADTGRQAVELARKHRPDVAVMDIAMPGLNGLEATRQIVREAPPVKVLVLSSYSDDEYVRKVIGWGGAGFLLKQAAAEELIKAIREVAAGNAFFSPTLSKRLVREYREAFLDGAPVEARAVQLSARESEVLQLIAEGLPSKGIAAELGIGIKTVGHHRQQLMNKLNVHDVAGLTRYALAKGIIRNHLSAPPETADRPPARTESRPLVPPGRKL